MPLIAFCALFVFVTQSPWQRYVCLVLLGLTSYLLAWSGGRGAIGATVVFLLLVAVFRIVSRRAILECVLALITGGLIAILFGQADYLLTQAERTITPGEATGHRMLLWMRSLEVWLESWLSFLFGFGPDAMRRYVRTKVERPELVQVHSALVQVLIEFGAVGLGLLLYGFAVIGRRLRLVLLNRRAPSTARLVAALLVAMGAYALIDGMLYHAIPFVLLMLLTAYLFSLSGLDAEHVLHSGVQESSASSPA